MYIYRIVTEVVDFVLVYEWSYSAQGQPGLVCRVRNHALKYGRRDLEDHPEVTSDEGLCVVHEGVSADCGDAETINIEA